MEKPILLEKETGANPKELHQTLQGLQLVCPGLMGSQWSDLCEPLFYPAIPTWVRIGVSVRPMQTSSSQRSCQRCWSWGSVWFVVVRRTGTCHGLVPSIRASAQGQRRITIAEFEKARVYFWAGAREAVESVGKLRAEPIRIA